MRNGQQSKRRMTKATHERPVRVEQGSGNVFADLGFVSPDLALAKAKLVQRIRALIAERGLTQVEAAKVLGLDQPKVSALVRGRVAGYSIERLFRFLNALGQAVEIKIHSSPGRTSNCVVVVT